jgi:XTP/dITP diphosphohydrolase
MKPLLFITGNPHKFAEARRLLKARGIIIRRADAEFAEARADDCETVARLYAGLCAKRFKRPLFVEDAGLFIPALGGFPGAYSAFVHQKVGNDGVLRLMRGIGDRSAKFVSAIAYADKAGKVRTFAGIAHGKIAQAELGHAGFGFDPIFVPKGKNETYAKKPGLKSDSHRARALAKLASYLKKKMVR